MHASSRDQSSNDDLLPVLEITGEWWVYDDDVDKGIGVRYDEHYGVGFELRAVDG